MILLYFGIFLVFLHQGVGRILVVIEKETAPTVEEKIDMLLEEMFHDDNKLITVRMSTENEAEHLKKVCLLEGVTGVIDLTWSGWPRLQELSLDSGIPYVLLESPVKGVVRAVDSILRGLRDAADTVIFLEDGRYKEEILYHLAGVSSLRVYLSTGLDPMTAKILLDMRPYPSFYIILGSTLAVSSMFNSALKLQLVKNTRRWFVFFTDFNYDEFSGSANDVTSIYPSSALCCDILKAQPSCECHHIKDFVQKEIPLNQASQLLLDVWKDLPTLQISTTLHCGSRSRRDANNETRIQFDQLLKQNVQSYPLLGVSSAPHVTLYPRISLDINSTLYKTRLASWTSDRGLSINHSRARKSVKRFFRVGVVEAVPWSYRVVHSEGGAPRDQDGLAWAGYCLDFIKRLSNDLRFDYEIVSSGEVGARDKDDSWTGLVGDLARGQTDLVVAPLTMTSEREEVIDFVAPYFDQTGISIVIRKPARSSSLFKFMTVLRLEVWLSIVAALVVTGFMIWFLEKYSPYSARNSKKSHPYPCREFTLKESFWFALTSFTPQGGGEAPKALSGRTLVAAFWLFVVLMLATFTANLAAFLTVERMQAPVQSLEQLSRQSKINYTVVKDSDTHGYFRNMKFAEDILYRMWKEVALNASKDQTQYRVWDYPIKEQYGTILKAVERAGPVPDAAMGFKKVNENENGWFALIHDAAEIKYELYRNCNLTEVGEVFAEQPYAVAVQQGSQLNDEISRVILDLQKERYFETLNAKYWNNSEGSACFNPADNEGITLESLGGVFIATLFGLVLSMITLAVEIIVHRRRENGKVQDQLPRQFYPEYISKREFGTEHSLRKPSKLIHPTSRVITVLPRSQLY